MQDNVVLDLGRIAQDLQIRKVQVESVVHLLDEGNTIPFITRYRKERTSGLDEDILRAIQRRVNLQRQLADRKQTILKSIQFQGKLTDELQRAILAADTAKRLEDLYLPFRPKKRTLASAARERGLEPLALAIWNRDPAVANLAELLPTFVNPEKELKAPEDVLAGVQHILAEQISEIADVRDAARRVVWDSGRLTTTKAENVPDDKGREYRDYFQFAEPVRQTPPHRILAINRGEKEGVIKAKVEHASETLKQAVLHHLPLDGHPHADFIQNCMNDALQRLLVPSLEREVRRELTDHAEEHALHVFARNLRRLLLQPPIRGYRVLAIDPGFRTGCKVAVLDEYGNLLEHSTIHPHPHQSRRGETKPEAAKPAEPAVAPPAQTSEAPPSDGVPEAVATSPEGVASSLPGEPVAAAAPPPTLSATPPSASHKRDEAKVALEGMVLKHQINVIALGNGTACRETEELVSELIAEKLPELQYVVVNEAGASHYSASPAAKEEFPELDATVRGTISIGRRLVDPLSELVKIDPQNIGVGLYQHDISPKNLKESVEEVIESCVNHVGVDVNTASAPLLRHVAGLNQLTARAIVDYRREHGPFKTRFEIKQVPGIGEMTFTQAAGFLKIPNAGNPLDATWIHPESYAITERLLTEMGLGTDSIRDKATVDEIREKLKSLPLDELCHHLDIGIPTFIDIADALSKPNRDPREDLPKPIFKKGILKLEDLQPGMELKGTVLNVVDFGAFVDVGLKDSGLVHISQLANRYIKSPYEVVAVGDVVTVWVMSVDQERRRVSLTMLKPGTERKPAERRQPPRREQPPQGQQGQRRDRGGRRDRRPPPQAQPQPPAAPAQTEPSQTEPAKTPDVVTPIAAVAAPTTPVEPPRRPQQQQSQQHQHQQPHRQHRGQRDRRQHQQYHQYQAPRREKPKPTLTEEELKGETPLRSFAELKALIDAKKQD